MGSILIEWHRYSGVETSHELGCRALTLGWVTVYLLPDRLSDRLDRFVATMNRVTR